MTLSSTLADRIRRLVPSLASTFDGEVVATRNAISRELVAGKSDWHGLAASIRGADQPSPAPTRSAEPPSFGDLARACRDLDRGRLRPHERTFVSQMCAMGFVRQPTSRQLGWMRDIYTALSRRAA